ncbi:modifier of mdg4-like isoform X14 [Anopheles bellator]|uniref:modifier of mdg4-like isoform X14 n=1 Tax=Anopheles bellator TaxID=139047 RepID=UPI002647B7A6|nr:modifier of mdg4-like isoform X14 [Anopheles bellator]
MADDEQFSLCWNNFNTNLSAGFHESLVQGDLVDVTLAAEGQLVKAHRLILSVCSPYFRKMFTQMPVNQHAFIFLKDVSHSALKDLIQFMYCGEVNVKQDALPAFISTAEALQIKGLTETGDSAPPPQPSPAKENIPTTPAPVSISTNTGSPRGKVQRSRVQSYKLESEESGDDKIVQIQSSTSHHSATGSQQAQQIQQVHVASGQKRILGQRILAPSMTNKRAKLSVSGNDMLDPSEATTQIQTVQIVKQLPSQTTEPEYVEMALEPISTKAEPDYSEEHTEIETVEAETEQDQSLAEHDQSADQEQGDDEGTYVEDEAYGDMSKYEESYFTEGEEGKAGVSGFAEPYTSDGTGNEQAAQDIQLNHTSIPERPPALNNFTPVPKRWYTAPLVFARNRRGTQNLHFRGYVYVQKKRYHRTMNWVCCKGANPQMGIRCKARVSTERNNKIRFGEHHHNHPPTTTTTTCFMWAEEIVCRAEDGKNKDVNNSNNSPLETNKGS